MPSTPQLLQPLDSAGEATEAWRREVVVLSSPSTRHPGWQAGTGSEGSFRPGSFSEVPKTRDRKAPAPVSSVPWQQSALCMPVLLRPRFPDLFIGPELFMPPAPGLDVHVTTCVVIPQVA